MEAAGNGASLNWQAVSGAKEYLVYRDNNEVATVSETFYLDEVEPGKTYAYNVVAVKNDQTMGTRSITEYGKASMSPPENFVAEPKKNTVKLVWDAVENATGERPLETYLGDINLFAVFDNEDIVSNITPNFDAVSKLDGQGLIISSSSNQYDFVSRYFCPKYGINEDPVTGSAHTTLIPYWSEKLNKISLTAKQVSKRGGELFCENTDNRVLIGGNAVLYMKGVVEID